MDTSHSLGIYSKVLQPQLCHAQGSLTPRDAALTAGLGWRDSGDGKCCSCHSSVFSLAHSSPMQRFWWFRHSPCVDKQDLDLLEAQDIRGEQWMCHTRQPEHTAGTKREQLSLTTTPCREQTAIPAQGKEGKITFSTAAA